MGIGGTTEDRSATARIAAMRYVKCGGLPAGQAGFPPPSLAPACRDDIGEASLAMKQREQAPALHKERAMRRGRV